MDRWTTGRARKTRGALLSLAALGPLLIGAGCRSASARPVSGTTAPGRETVIEADEIVRMGARTAWDVVRVRAPRLVAGEGGGPAGMRIQEPRSANADETPLLVVDGTQMIGVSYLEQLPASEVVRIRILDSEAAFPLYGLRAAGGAIVVQTKGAH
jgi:outer membrane cobalamin receptor